VQPVQRLENRTYAGAPGETVTVETEVEGSGAVTILVDGAEADDDPTFDLKMTPGEETLMHIALIGAVGESCVVRISEVDGGSDGDLLLCQSLDPAPVHHYRFIVAPAGAMTALDRTGRSRSAARGGGAARRRRTPAGRRKK
jgi:hypothetical protein